MNEKKKRLVKLKTTKEEVFVANSFIERGKLYWILTFLL